MSMQFSSVRLLGTRLYGDAAVRWIFP